jgi:ABC-type Na+ efflux pump permease subunit
LSPVLTVFVIFSFFRHYNIGIAQWAKAIEAKGGKVSDKAKDLLIDSTFATLTNVNFSDKVSKSHISYFLMFIVFPFLLCSVSMIT